MDSNKFQLHWKHVYIFLILCNAVLLLIYLYTRNIRLSQTQPTTKETTVPSVTSFVLTQENAVVQRPENYFAYYDPVAVPTEMKQQYNNTSLYLGTIIEVGTKTFKIASGRTTLEFTWATGPVSNNTVIFISDEEKGEPTKFLTPIEFMDLEKGTVVNVLADRNNHAWQVILR